jgi:hypothetical protein
VLIFVIVEKFIKPTKTFKAVTGDPKKGVRDERHLEVLRASHRYFMCYRSIAPLHDGYRSDIQGLPGCRRRVSGTKDT